MVKVIRPWANITWYYVFHDISEYLIRFSEIPRVLVRGILEVFFFVRVLAESSFTSMNRVCILPDMGHSLCPNVLSPMSLPEGIVQLLHLRQNRVYLCTIY